MSQQHCFYLPFYFFYTARYSFIYIALKISHNWGLLLLLLTFIIIFRNSRSALHTVRGLGPRQTWGQGGRSRHLLLRPPHPALASPPSCSMFIKVQETPNPNSLKFIPGVQVCNTVYTEFVSSTLKYIVQVTSGFYQEKSCTVCFF